MQKAAEIRHFLYLGRVSMTTVAANWWRFSPTFGAHYGN